MSSEFEPSKNKRPGAVVLVSGGLDSATVLAIALDRGFDPHAISFDYGQRHRHELEAAREVCHSFGVTRHIEFPIDLSVFGGSALTDRIDVPKGRDETTMASGIPITYVPARNTVFLSIALAWAEQLGLLDLFIGVNAVDYSGYPDCRPEYIAAFQEMANLATKAGVEQPDDSPAFTVHTPLIDLTKAEIIRAGIQLGVNYGLTHSCYDPGPNGGACGECDSCLLRKRGFADAGVPDPTRYAD